MFTKLYDLYSNDCHGYWAERILAELIYIEKVSEVNNNIFEKIINDTENFIYSKFIENGAILKEDVLLAENMLRDTAIKAKSYKMICAAHAHIDMNWMWRWDETVAVTLDTFRTMLCLMNEYPDFRFSQSQASVYQIVEEYDPEMLEEIKRRVKEGRWEITASTWVETDKNMPSGESLSRHILYTKKYLSELFDIDPDTLNIDFEPDTFGHSQNVPEILSKGGVEFYYHCRGRLGANIYNWKAPSGASILVYREPLWYNAPIRSSLAHYVPEFCSKYGIDTMIKVYGVGDHGGGPTRRDIEKIIDMSTWPVFPQIEFGTFRDFFNILKKSRSSFEEVSGEQNFIFDGCYTTQTRIKEGNRVCERMLGEAELFCSIASKAYGLDYPSEKFEKSWEKVLFNHFHDIITGSGVIGTREYAMGLYQQVMAFCGTKKSYAFRKIADRIDTSGFSADFVADRSSVSEGAGAGFGTEHFITSQIGRSYGNIRILHFFNSSMYERTEVAEAILWDWTGDPDRIIVKDGDDNITAHQIVKDRSVNGLKEYWGHMYFRLLVKVTVPAGGYATYFVTEDKNTGLKLHYDMNPIEYKPEEYFIENDLLKVTFNRLNASITSIIHKETGEELADSSRPSGVFRLIDEDDHNEMTAWIVGRYMGIENLNSSGVKIRNVSGPSGLRNAVEYDISFRDSSLKVRVWLEQGSPLIRYKVICDWKEYGSWRSKVPQLGFYMPLNYKCTSYKYDVPFGVAERPGLEMDVPANSFALGQGEDNSKNSVMVLAKSKYGFRCTDDDIYLTLIRGSYDPDPYPETGFHEIEFAVGVLIADNNKELLKISYDYNNPINVVSGSIHEGSGPLCKGFISLDKGSLAISAVKITEDGSKSDLVIRLYETEGRRTEGVLSLFDNPRSAYYADINEGKSGYNAGDIKINGNRLNFTAEPYSIVSIIVEF